MRSAGEPPARPRGPSLHAHLAGARRVGTGSFPRKGPGSPAPQQGDPADAPGPPADAAESPRRCPKPGGASRPAAGR